MANNAQIPQPLAANQQTLLIDGSRNGVSFECGPAGGGSTGTWTFQWVPDVTFDGSLTVMGRVAGPAATADGVPQVPVPYRAAYINGAVTGSPESYTNVPIVGTSLFFMDTAQLSPGFLVTCNAGFGKLYLLDAGTY